MRNKRCAIKLIALSMFSVFLTGQLQAQGDMNQLLKAGLVDVNKLASLYIEPMGRGLSTAMGSNWYNTAAPHKVGGFDITVGGSVAMMPSSLQSFKIDNNTFTYLKPTSGKTETETAPTFSGKDGDGVSLDVYADGEKISTITTPSAVLEKYVPMPNVQVAAGLPYKTELIVRFIPKITRSDATVKQFGIGIKHDFLQWIPVLNHLPFDASVLIAYNKFNTNYAFSNPLTPHDLDASYPDPADVSAYKNQKIDLTSKAFTMNLLVSKKLLFFTPYLGLGFTRSVFELGLKGTYPILDNQNVTGLATLIVPEKINDPVKVKYKSFLPGATVGFRLKILWVLAFHAQYTFQKYPVASAGFGINFR